MKLIIVKFACTREDPIELFALTEKQYDRWFDCEPLQGYFICEEIGEARLTDEAIQYVRGINISNKLKQPREEVKNSSLAPPSATQMAWKEMEKND